MKKSLPGSICALVALALALSAPAGAAVTFGVSPAVGPPNADLAFTAMNDLGLSDARIVLLWDPAQPTTIPYQADLDYLIPLAAIHAVRVVISVSPAHPRDLTSSSKAPAQFASFLQSLARTYPTVKDYVIGNEPNQPRFWQPQFNSHRVAVSGAAYEAVLARSYDALKAVDPKITVVGLGLSPRGNDTPSAKSNVSISPIRFLRDVGAAYRKSRRTKPIMDELGFHPYPASNSDSPAVGYRWPKAGFSNLDRIKQAVWDAFHGTKQPLFNERGTKASPRALKLDLDETGWQVKIPPGLASLYSGVETAQLVSEPLQARYYADLVNLVSCDPNVRSLSFFQLFDEPNLDRWQAGFIRLDGTHRPSYDAVKQAIADTQGRCAIPPVGWKHATGVVGAKVASRATPYAWVATARAQEGALFTAGVFRVAGPKVGHRTQRVIAGALARRRAAANVTIGPTVTRSARIRTRRLHTGWYVLAVRVKAAMNPGRASLFLTKPRRLVGA